MFKHMSIRWRLTLFSIFMLTLCCVGLTFVLNISAFQYIDSSTPSAMTTIAQQAVEGETNDEVMQAIPLLAATEAKKGFGIESVLYMMLFVICGGALTYAIVEKTLKPLHTLDAQVKNMNVANLSEHLKVPLSKDEITDLTISFNDMSDKLHNAFVIQQRFSASAAHELRTPLAILQTKIDVFRKRKTCTKEEYDALIDVFETQTHRLRDLIKNLLEMNTGNESMEQSVVSLQDVINEILLDVEAIANDKDITIVQHCADCNVIGNIDLLYRAFYNVIENGIKYSDPGKHITITICQMNEKNVEICICDQGIGITEEEKKHIFEPFYQVHKDSGHGVGLGLAIVNTIVKKHQGTILVQDGQDGGTCFKITLPLRR